MTTLKTHTVCLVGIIVAVVSVSVLCAGFLSIASAIAMNWVGATLHYSEVPNQELLSSDQSNCVNKTMTVTGVQGIVSGADAKVCLYDKGDWSYGKYAYNYREWYGSGATERGWAVRLGNNGPMHRLTDGMVSDSIDVPGGDGIISRRAREGGAINYYFDYYKNFKSGLHKNVASSGEVTYTYAQPPDFTLSMPNKTPIPVYNSPGISNNGKWAAVETTIGFLRIDLDTLQVKRFTPLTYNYTIGYGPSTQFAITNDGQHVAVGGGYNSDLGSHPGFRLYDIPDSCGDAVTDSMTSETLVSQLCPSGSFESVLKEMYYQNVDKALYPSFDDGGGQLTVQANAANNAKPASWVRLTVDGYTPAPDITYLALGDSYSSGEGDIQDGSTHYLPGTEGKGECHISDRSYPFLLQNYYSISSSNMKSVACSGAQVVFDYIGDDTNYTGQDHRLENRGLSGSKLRVEQQKALTGFTPGEVKQLSFVKKYKPPIVTLTGGGNDVGFADILKYCAGPGMACGYAQPGSDLNKILYRSLDSQYGINKLFIEEMQRVSPSTRVIIVGYPSFVTDANVPCLASSAGYLDVDERKMINDAVGYMDSILQSVAHDTSVSYVDVENALDGGRICEAKGYVNTIKDAGITKVIFDNDPSAFHPNAKGHSLIASAIESSGVFEYPVFPEESSYTLKSTLLRTTPFSFIEQGIAVSNDVMRLLSNDNMFSAYTNINIQLFSDPTDLGTYQSDANGKLSISLPTKGLPVGYHVLVVTGTGNDGQPVQYYQFISIVPPGSLSVDTTGGEGKSGSYSVSGGEERSLYRPIEGVADSATSMKSDYHQQHSDTISSKPELDGVRDRSKSSRSASVTRFLLVGILIACVILLIVLGGIYHAKQKKNK